MFTGCQSNLFNRVIQAVQTMQLIISSKRKMKFFTHNLPNYFLKIMCEHSLLIIYVCSYTYLFTLYFYSIRLWNYIQICNYIIKHSRSLYYTYWTNRSIQLVSKIKNGLTAGRHLSDLLRKLDFWNVCEFHDWPF